jgi:hypothetical protein
MRRGSAPSEEEDTYIWRRRIHTYGGGGYIHMER